MSELKIIDYGHRFIDDHPVEAFRASLTSAFKYGRADFIILDSNIRGQKFLATCTAWAIDEGLLYNDHNEDHTQEVISSFRLTEKGKKEILD